MKLNSAFFRYPPEAILEKKFSEKSDVWSFGVTLWEAFSNGDTPFQEIKNNKFVEYMKNIDEESPKLTKPINCPENVFEVIEKCLQIDKKERPSFVELCEDLNRVKEALQDKHDYLNN